MPYTEAVEELTPEPESRQAQVLKHLQQGTSQRTISRLLGIPRSSIYGWEKAFVAAGFIEKPDQPTQKANLSHMLSGKKGGILNSVMPLAQLGMYKTEIVIALNQTGLEIKRSQVSRTIRDARHTGFQYEWENNPEAEAMIKKDNKMPLEIIAERVHFWLEAKNVLEQDGTLPLPQSRKDWLLLSRYAAICQRLSASQNEDEQATAEMEQAVFLTALEKETQTRLQTPLQLIQNHYNPPIEIKPADTQDFWSTLYTENYQRIYRYVLNKIGNPESAEDITQEVFIKGIEKINTFEDRGIPISSWLYRIAHNATVDYLRRQTTHSSREIYFDDSYPVYASDKDTKSYVEEKELIGALLKSLTPLLRQIFILRFSERLKIDEIARITDTSPGMIKAYIYNMRQKLRTQ